MVIDTNSINPAQPGRRNGGADSTALDQKAASNNNSEQVKTASPTTTDTVKLSSQAQSLSSLQETLGNLPEVDEARVEQIRQQIADGSYRVDAEKIATAILRDDQSF